MGVLYPPRCLLCDANLPLDCPATLCVPCRRSIRPLAAPLCTRCGLPWPEGDRPCGRCTGSEMVIRRVRSFGRYAPGEKGERLCEAIHRLKYGGVRELGPVLGELMAGAFPYPPGELDVVVPVPLHPSRLRERGFNQACLLSRPIARRHGLPVAPLALARRRPTAAQAGLAAAQRAANVEGAFVVRHAAAVRGRCVLLVDDVFTSGATATACARALLGAGAAAVDVYALARVL